MGAFLIGSASQGVLTCVLNPRERRRHRESPPPAGTSHLRKRAGDKPLFKTIDAQVKLHHIVPEEPKLYACMMDLQMVFPRTKNTLLQWSNRFFHGLRGTTGWFFPFSGRQSVPVFRVPWRLAQMIERAILSPGRCCGRRRCHQPPLTRLSGHPKRLASVKLGIRTLFPTFKNIKEGRNHMSAL